LFKYNFKKKEKKKKESSKKVFVFDKPTAPGDKKGMYMYVKYYSRENKEQTLYLKVLYE
jgi:hypothetical protein